MFLDIQSPLNAAVILRWFDVFKKKNVSVLNP